MLLLSLATQNYAQPKPASPATKALDGFSQIEAAIDRDPMTTLRQLRSNAAIWAPLASDEKQVALLAVYSDLRMLEDLRKLLGEMGQNRPPDVRLQGRILLAESRLAYADAKLRASYNKASDALILARSAKLAELEARALDKISISQAALHPQQSMASAKEMARLVEAGSVPAYFRIYANAMEADARAYSQGISEALALHRVNAALAATFKHPFDESAALASQLNYLTELAKYEEAITLAGVLLTRFAEPELGEWRAIALEARAFARGKLKQVTSALQDIALARQTAKPRPGSSLDLTLLSTELDILLANDDLKSARALLTPERISAVSETEGYDDLPLLVAKVLADSKQHETANKVLAKSYELLAKRLTGNLNEKLNLQTQLLEEARLTRENALLERENAVQAAQLESLRTAATVRRAWLLAALAMAICGLGAAAFIWRQRRRFERLANGDALTGTASRRYVLQMASRVDAQAAAGQSNYALAVLDIDHFKTINDQFGHAVGDTVLRAVAGALNAALQNPLNPDQGAATTLGRMGGEEFLVVLPNASEAAALAVAEALRSAVSQLRLAELGERAVTVSIGVALSAYSNIQTETGNKTATELERTLQRADSALYAAKAAGRDQVCAAPEAV